MLAAGMPLQQELELLAAAPAAAFLILPHPAQHKQLLAPGCAPVGIPARFVPGGCSVTGLGGSLLHCRSSPGCVDGDVVGDFEETLLLLIWDNK